MGNSAQRILLKRNTLGEPPQVCLSEYAVWLEYRIQGSPFINLLATHRHSERYRTEQTSTLRKGPTIVKNRESAVVGKEMFQALSTLWRQMAALHQLWKPFCQIRHQNSCRLRRVHKDVVLHMSIQHHFLDCRWKSHIVRNAACFFELTCRKRFPHNPKTI